MITSLLNQPCTIHNRTPTGDVDDRGNPTYADADPVESVCYAEQVKRISAEGAEHTIGQDTATEQWHLVFGPGEIVTAASVVELAGLRLQIQGDPWPAWDPFTRALDHLEAHGLETRAVS